MNKARTSLTFDRPVVLVGGVPDPVGLSALPPKWPVIAADSGVKALGGNIHVKLRLVRLDLDVTCGLTGQTKLYLNHLTS